MIAGLLLALKNNPDVTKKLNGLVDSGEKDGDFIFKQIEDFLDTHTSEQTRNVLLGKFNFIKENVVLNTINKDLGVTPIKYFANVLKEQVLEHFEINTDLDILGNLYGTAVKYGKNETNNPLGIVLTPQYVTSLMADLIDINSKDYVLDPACGSGGFLISALNKMLKQNLPENKIRDIKQNHIYGIEIQDKLFTLATSNMLLRGAGKSNIQLANIFDIDGEKMKNLGINKVLLNPPYSQGKTIATRNLSELSFIRKALSMVNVGGKLAAIVPQSAVAGKNNYDQEIKKEILKSNTLDAVITMNPNIFPGVGTRTAIAIFTVGVPHAKDKLTSFVDFSNDGYSDRRSVDSLPDEAAKKKRAALVKYIQTGVPNASLSAFQTKIKPEEDWLYNFFYFNEGIPKPGEFTRTVQDYLTFKFDQTIHGRGYLFERSDS